MADTRINGLKNTATSFESDDFIAVDGAKKGTRKFSAQSGPMALREDANIKCNLILNNPEYAYAIIDYSGKLLFGIKKNGSVEWNKGIPTHIKEILASITSNVSANTTAITTKVDKVEGKSLVNATFADGVSVVSNEEFICAWLDKEGRFLFGVKKDGSFDWQKGVSKSVENKLEYKVDKENGKSLINETFANGVSVVSNEEYICAWVDADRRFLFGVKNDGSFYWQKGFDAYTKVDKVTGKSLVLKDFADTQSKDDNEEYLTALRDSSKKVIEALNRKGQRVFFTKPKFNAGIDWSAENLTDLGKALKANGFSSGCGDWSDIESLQISTPKCAILNFSGVDSFPTTKTDDLEATLEFWDCQGNFFKKKITAFNAQGNSSLAYDKKNLAFDFDDFSLKIGDWVAQDSFHIKSFYTDYFRGVGECGYKLYKQILDSRGEAKNRSWKLALLNVGENWGEGLGYGAETDDTLRIDDGALCFPDGFPCLVFLNGTFNGIYAFQLKKQRDNYMMGKKNKKHIHLDGVLGSEFFKDGSIDWTAFEVRNPKNLKTIDGSDYDGDNPTELSDSDSFTKSVKDSIVALSGYYAEIHAASTTEEKKALVEKYFDVENLIDYQIFCDITLNADGVRKNWQWTTWDGVKWFVNAYDLDSIFGASFNGDTIHVPATSRLGNYSGSPLHYIQELYLDELKARYAELRKNGTVTVANIIGLVDSWVKAVGYDNFKKEWKKWPDSPCNIDMTVNDSYWELQLDDEGKPAISYTKDDYYSGETSYSVGDVVSYNPGDNYFDAGWYYKFTCVTATTGNNPATKAGFRDSIYRLNNWVAKTIANMDTLYNYNEEA